MSATAMPEAQGKVSVVIPVYNTRDLIRAVNSVLEQSLRPIEILLVDDHSEDEATLRHLEECQKKSTHQTAIKVFRLGKNSGPSAARNYGWNLCSGDYIAFLDADDFWKDTKLEIQTAFMQSHPEYALTAHWFNHQPTRHSGEIHTSDLLWSNSISPCCTMVRKSLQIRYDENFRYCEDHEFAVNVSLQERIFILKDVLTFLGRKPLSEGGASSNRWKMRKGQLAIYWKLRRRGKIGLLTALGFSGISMTKHLIKSLNLKSLCLLLPSI